MFQLGMVVQQRIPMTNIYDTPEGIFGSPIRHQNHQNSENLLKRCLEWCYKALYCRGQQVLNTPCPAPFIAPSKSMIQKTIQQKISKNNKPHFKLSAHKHTHTHTETHHTTTNLPRCCWCFNLCNLLCFHELHQVCESVSQARKAHENWFPLVRTNLKMMMSSNFCKKSNQNAEKRQPKAAFGSQKQTPKPLFLEIPRIKRQKQYLTPPHRTTPTTNPGA